MNHHLLFSWLRNLGFIVYSGLVAVLGLAYTWVPLLLGILGALLLFYTSILLIVESRVAVAAVNEEMNFVLRLGQQKASQALLKRRRTNNRVFRILRQ